MLVSGEALVCMRERGQEQKRGDEQETSRVDSHEGIRQRGIIVFSHGLVFKKKIEKREIDEKR